MSEQDLKLEPSIDQSVDFAFLQFHRQLLRERSRIVVEVVKLQSENEELRRRVEELEK